LSATCLLSGEPACDSKLTPYLLPRHTEKYPVPLLLDGSFIVCGGYFFYHYTQHLYYKQTLGKPLSFPFSRSDYNGNVIDALYHIYRPLNVSSIYRDKHNFPDTILTSCQTIQDSELAFTGLARHHLKLLFIWCMY